MAYDNGREDRKWRIWKEAEEKVLREHGVDEATLTSTRDGQLISVCTIRCKCPDCVAIICASKSLSCSVILCGTIVCLSFVRVISTTVTS